MTSKKGEDVTGVFTMKPNVRNVRDLDFEISVNFEVRVLINDFGNLFLWSIFSNHLKIS